MRLIMIFSVVCACHGSDTPPPPTATATATAPATAPSVAVADAGVDARVIEPKVPPAPLACPAGSTQIAHAHASGHDLVRELVCRDAEGQQQGPAALYDTEGALAQESNYSHGQLDGAFVEYRHGAKYQVGRYTAGTMTGTWTTQYPDGKRECVSERAHDTTVEMTCYSESGHVTVRGKSPDGVDDGMWEWFADDGTPRAATMYKNGEALAYYVWKQGRRTKATYDEFVKVDDVKPRK